MIEMPDWKIGFLPSVQPSHLVLRIENAGAKLFERTLTYTQVWRLCSEAAKMIRESKPDDCKIIPTAG